MVEDEQLGWQTFSAHRNDSLEMARRSFSSHGLAIVRDVFSRAEVQHMRANILKKLPLFRPPRLVFRGTLVNFLARPDFGFMGSVHSHPTLLAVLSQVVFPGEAFRFVSHNDIGIDRLVNWHKDRLNNQYAGGACGRTGDLKATRSLRLPFTCKTTYRITIASWWYRARGGSQAYI